MFFFAKTEIRKKRKKIETAIVFVLKTTFFLQ